VIRSIEISRLRGIREGKLADLTPLVVLVGPNGSGKSTILDALLIAANPQSGEGMVRAVSRREDLPYGGRWLFWKGAKEASATIALNAGEIGARTCELVLRSAGPDHATIECLVKDEDANKQVRQTGASAHFQKGSQAGAGGSFAPMHDVPELRFLDSQVGVPRTPLHQLFSRVVEQGLRNKIFAVLKDLIPDIEDIEILAEWDTPVVYLTFRDRAVPVALAGDGMRLLLRLSFELVTHPGGLVLMEEPEAHMHPGAIRQCARAIVAAVRRGVQVVLSTHSLELIDALLSESTDADLEQVSVYRVKLEDGVLKSFRSQGEQIAFARTTIQEDLR
jgi:predicted ATPase